MNKTKIFGILIVLTTTVTAATALTLMTAQPSHAACLIGKSGAKICSGGSVTGGSFFYLYRTKIE
jgi:hypothetical protein